MRKLSLLFLGVLLFLGAWFFFKFSSLKPSHDRQWELGQERLPTFTIQGDILSVQNFRNFDWTGPFAAEPHYETRTFRLDRLTDLDVFISHFDELEGLAHIFLSFGFEDSERLVLSLEARREVNEKFSPLGGLFRRYEVLYVAGSESDFVGVRIKYRGERVYRYDTIATPSQTRDLLETFGRSINALAAQPMFYHTLTQNCTNTLTRQVESVTGIDFPPTAKTFLPGYFDAVLYEMGLLKVSGTFEQTKQAASIDPGEADPITLDIISLLRSNRE